MIFVTVGTHDQSFNRLLTAMDDLAAKYEEQVIAQVGHSDYKPEHMEWFDLVPESKINTYYEDASVVVGHAGAGTIISALSYKKPLVLMPRRKEYGEVINDHQLELISELRERDGIFVADSIEDLHCAIQRGLEAPQSNGHSSGTLVEYFSDNLERMVGR